MPLSDERHRLEYHESLTGTATRTRRRGLATCRPRDGAATLAAMRGDRIGYLDVTVGEARERLVELGRERAAAIVSGVAEIESYRRDLEGELELWRSLLAVRR